MESIFSPSSLLTLSKTLRSTHSPPSNPSIFSHLHRHLSSTNTPLTRSLSSTVLTRRLGSAIDTSKFASFAYLRLLCSVVHPVRCVSSFAASGGGSGIGGGGGGGGGDGSEGGGGSKVNDVSGAVDDVSALSPDVIVLDVGGMTCGGCAASVKRILESQPRVSSASVNLATETAIVWPLSASEAKVVPNWLQELGEMLAKHLTSCGFQSNLRGQRDEEGEIP